jgi:signal peptidase II
VSDQFKSEETKGIDSSPLDGQALPEPGPTPPTDIPAGYADEDDTEVEAPAPPQPEPARQTSLLKLPRAPIWQRIWVLILAGIILLLDQPSKRFIEQWLPIGQSWAPFPDYAHLFQITHTFNTGGVFGILQGWNEVIALVAVFVTGFILIYSWLLPAGHLLLRTALGLQLGGALGNLIDRLRQGHVTDFMDFGPWPVWNIADLAIVSGAVLLGFVLLQESLAERRKREVAESQSALHRGRDEATGTGSIPSDEPTNP